MHRLSQLDCLRAVAVLLVLGGHFQPPKPEDTGALVAVLTRTWMYGGWTGVDLFFVLSGFLVSGLLFREYQERGAVRPGRFLIRRGFKIYPAFYTMAIPILLLAQAPARQVVSELFFVQNYLLPNFFGYTWTLAVEEHFYLLLAAVVWCAVRYRPDAGALLIGALNLNLPDSRLVRGFARIGAYSYSIYLWHGVANSATRPMLSFGIDWQVYAVAYVTGAGLLGILTARVIEMPALAIRDRYVPARHAPSRQTVAAA